MDMHAAALAPVQPHISDRDRAHPSFPQYQLYRRAMSRLLVQADSFQDWLSQRETQKLHEDIAQHPRFLEFQKWMRDNKGGDPKRTKLVFPENFKAWLGGSRW